MQFLKWLSETKHHKQNRNSHSQESCLVIAHLDTVKVQSRHRVGRNQTVKRKNLVHLEGSGECRTPLSNNFLG